MCVGQWVGRCLVSFAGSERRHRTAARKPADLLPVAGKMRGVLSRPHPPCDHSMELSTRVLQAIAETGSFVEARRAARLRVGAQSPGFTI